MPMKKTRAEIEHFHNFLRTKGLKKTYQKDLILETFLNTEGHLSVEDVYAQVKKRDKKVGVVTVFRTLRSLKECGIAREITLGDGLTRFEHCYGHPYHHHIICEKCHKAIEFVCPELERIQDEIIRKYNFRAGQHRFQTYGLCEDCLGSRTRSVYEKYDTEKIFARDALKMALAMENHCLEFYRKAAQSNKDAGGREIFERMVIEEEKHVADLKAKLNELHRHEKNLEMAPVFLHFDDEELESLVPDLSRFEGDGELYLDSLTSIELSSELNRKASEFFRNYADRFTDTLGKRIFVNFAAEEAKHSDLMKQRMEGRIQSGA